MKQRVITIMILIMYFLMPTLHAQEKYIVFGVPNTAVRATASVKGKKLGTYNVLDTVVVVNKSKKGDWGEVKFGKKKGFVKMSTLKNPDDVPALFYEEVTPLSNAYQPTRYQDDESEKLGPYLVPVENPIAPSTKISKKQQKLWDALVAAGKANDASKLRSACIAVIASCKNLDDTLAYKARQVLARYDIKQGSMNDVYNSFAYFRYYACYHPDRPEAAKMRDDLWDRYWEMVKFDQEANNHDGLWMSTDAHNLMLFLSTDTPQSDLSEIVHYPVLAFRIKNGAATLESGCAISILSHAYTSSSKPDNNMADAQVILPAHLPDLQYFDSLYNVSWGDESLRKGQTDMARDVYEGSADIRAKSQAIIQSDETANFGEKVAATAVTGAVNAGLNLLGDLLATTKEKVNSLTAYINKWRSGYMDVAMRFQRQKFTNGVLTYKTDTFTEEWPISYQRRMVKVYPHMEIYYKGTYEFSYLPLSKDERKYCLPNIYPRGNRYGLTVKDASKEDKNIFYMVYDSKFVQEIQDISDLLYHNQKNNK